MFQFLRNILKRASSQSFGHPGQWHDPALYAMFGGGRDTLSGIDVTPESLLKIPGAYAGIRRLSSTMGMVPFSLRERTGKGESRIASDHPLHAILHDQPNEIHTAFEFRELMTAWALVYHNAYGQIIRDGGGTVKSIWPWHPTKVKPVRHGTGIIYKFSTTEGEQTLPSDEVFHLRIFPLDIIQGTPPTNYIGESVGLTMAADQHSAAFFGNGAMPGGIITCPGRMDTEDKNIIRNAWTKMFKGKNTGGVAVIDMGREYEPISTNPENSQLIEARKFQLTEQARILGVTPDSIGDYEKATFSNIEQQAISYVMHSAQPLAVRWEQTVARDLLTKSERGRFYAKLNLTSLLRADSETRYKVYQMAILNSILNPNEVRAFEDWNPYEGGDTYYQQANLMAVGDEPRPVPGMPQGRQGVTHDIETRANAKLRDRWRKVIHKEAERLVKRIADDIGKAAKKHIRSVAGFDRFIAKYFGKDVPKLVRDALSVALRGYGEAVAAGIGPTPNLGNFLDSYIDTLGVRQAAKLRRAIDKTALGDTAKYLSNVEGELDDWVTGAGKNRAMADRITNDEQKRVATGATRAAYLEEGVTEVKWVTSGDNCPLCDEMDGRIVGIEKNFLSEGENVKGSVTTKDGKENFITLKTSSDVSGPPLHEGCDCDLERG